MNRVFFFFLFALGLILISESCSESTSPKRSVSNSFYYWKTVFDLNEKESSFLADLKCTKLFVRFFDLDWDSQTRQIIPIASLTVNNSPDSTVEIIPVVFITNRSFQNSSFVELDSLVKKMLKKIQLTHEYFPQSTWSELQIDCDWTKSTKDIYFEFLKRLKIKLKEQGCILSTTIRLHQMKYASTTGVPPVDRGVLMFYNVANVADPMTNNSILDIGVAEKYLVNFSDYPLDLDLAFPLFNWGVLFRNGRMIKLINGLDEGALNDTSRFIKTSENHFKVNKSTYLQAYYLYQGDEIRLEASSLELLQNSVRVLKPHLNHSSIKLCYYHLDDKLLKNFSSEELESVAQILSQ